MSLPCITIPSVEILNFDGNDFVSWKSQMSLYLREMNPQIWWMVDVGLSHALEHCPQIQTQKKCLYLKAHASNGLSSALSAEIKMKSKWSMVGLKELTFFGRCLSKCMAQAIVRNHHQMLRRTSHHRLHFLIGVKKGNQVLKKKKQNLLTWKNWTVWFLKPDYPVLA
jgi:hypothetical protein